MNWESWKIKLKDESVRIFGPDHYDGDPIEFCGEDAWFYFYNDGYTPEDVLLEDFTNE